MRNDDYLPPLPSDLKCLHQVQRYGLVVEILFWLIYYQRNVFSINEQIEKQ
jgi:hypothetical protein